MLRKNTKKDTPFQNKTNSSSTFNISNDLFQSVILNKSATASTPTYTYHCAGFRVGKDGKSTWIDGVFHLDRAILDHSGYLGLKLKLSEHYDIPNTNIVLTSLSRLDTLKLEVPPAMSEARG